MMPTSFAAPVAPRASKIKNSVFSIFERGEDLLQNGILHFSLSQANRQKSCHKVRIYTEQKLTFLKGEKWKFPAL